MQRHQTPNTIAKKEKKKEGIKWKTYRVPVLEVVEGALPPHELAVDDHGEVDVQDDVVVDGQAQDDPDQLELRVALKRRRVEPVRLGLRIEREHGCRQTERERQTQ